ARPGDDARGRQLLRRFELGALRCPRVDGGADHALHVRSPARARREARIVLPLRMTDEIREPGELVLADDLHDNVSIRRAKSFAYHREAVLERIAHTH